ncbi:MAG: ABC transporter permease [Lachnospiraceae bacterium]|nr:ABC transporter permease [Lachnospiraceae bacterium]
MLKLIRLEWKKNKIGKYIFKAAIMTVILSLLIVGMAGELEAVETVQAYGTSMINASVDLFTNMAYIILTGVMLSTFIVGAYEKRMMHLMFSYPISRKKILLSEIFAVWIFSFTAMAVSKVFIYLMLLTAKPFLGISAASIQFGTLSFWMNILIGSAAMVSTSYIALPVGLLMKSSKAAIVAAVIIMLLTQENIGKATLVNNIPFYGILLFLAVWAVFLSLHGVEIRDLP